MYETDLERLVAQARRVQTLGTEVLEDAETLAENDVDPASGVGISGKQTDLQDELEQALSDFSAALERSDSVARRPEYEYDGTTFSHHYDSETGTVVFTYEGPDGVTPADLSLEVTVGGTVRQDVFSGTLTTGDTGTIDVSGEESGTEVRLSWRSSAVGGRGLPNGGRSPVDRSALPASNLTEQEREFSLNYVVE